jgi:acetyl-CoA carboxylase biotin carboxyl carrier protein
MIDLRYVKKLIEMMDGSSVDSVEITSDKGMKIRISKTPQQRGTVQIPTPVPMPALLPAAVPTNASRMTPADGMAAVSEPEAAPRTEVPKTKLLEVKSPMVGTYYAAPEPGAKPYVAVGSRIAKGQILCIIEAMKIMNEIECEVHGRVKRIVAEHGQPVEYGQMLMVIELL